MPKKKRKEKITTVKFPSYGYTATISDIDIIHTDQEVDIIQINYLLQHPQLDDGFGLIETITNSLHNPRSEKFFAFLRDSGLDCEDCASWIGIVFKGDIAYECFDKTLFPVFSNRQLISTPKNNKFQQV